MFPLNFFTSVEEINENIGWYFVLLIFFFLPFREYLYNISYVLYYFGIYN